MSSIESLRSVAYLSSVLDTVATGVTNCPREAAAEKAIIATRDLVHQKTQHCVFLYLMQQMESMQESMQSHTTE